MVFGEVLLVQVEETDAVAAPALCFVHCDIGMVQQLFAGQAEVVADCDADAGGHLDLEARDDERSGQRGLHAGHDRRGLRRGFEIFQQDDELVAVKAGRRVARAYQLNQPLGHGYQQLVADAMTVGVVDRLEAVQIDEQHGRRLVRALVPDDSVLEALQDEGPVRQAGQGVVQGRGARSFRDVEQVGPSLCVEQICGDDVGQCLRVCHGLVRQSPWRVPVQVERAELAGTVPQREGEHCRQPGDQGPGREVREPDLASKVRYRDGLARVVRRKTGTLTQFGLQLLETQGGVVRGGDVTGHCARRDERHTGRCDWQDLDDALDKAIEN